MAQGAYIGAIDQLQVVFAILIFVREHLRVNELKGTFTLLHDSSRGWGSILLGSLSKPSRRRSMGCLGYSKCFELYSVTNDIPEETMLESEGCVIIWNEESCLSVGRGRVAGISAVPRLCVPFLRWSFCKVV